MAFWGTPGLLGWVVASGRLWPCCGWAFWVAKSQMMMAGDWWCLLTAGLSQDSLVWKYPNILSFGYETVNTFYWTLVLLFREYM